MITSIRRGLEGHMEGFKKFILRGNVVDLAVGVVIGAAFGTVVTAFVKGVVNPIIGLLGSQNFDQYTWCLHGTCGGDATNPKGHVLLYGTVITAVIAFLLTAAAIYFFVVIPVGHLVDRARKEPDPTHKDCPECLSSVPIEATRCAFCTVELAAT